MNGLRKGNVCVYRRKEKKEAVESDTKGVGASVDDAARIGSSGSRGPGRNGRTRRKRRKRKGILEKIITAQSRRRSRETRSSSEHKPHIFYVGNSRSPLTVALDGVLTTSQRPRVVGGLYRNVLFSTCRPSVRCSCAPRRDVIWLYNFFFRLNQPALFRDGVLSIFRCFPFVRFACVFELLAAFVTSESSYKVFEFRKIAR